MRSNIQWARTRSQSVAVVAWFNLTGHPCLELVVEQPKGSKRWAWGLYAVLVPAGDRQQLSGFTLSAKITGRGSGRSCTGKAGRQLAEEIAAVQIDQLIQELRSRLDGESAAGKEAR